MAETEQITVADTSAGPGAQGEPGQPVSLPVVELLTGRGFVTGKSGSGKSNTASVIAEKLLDNGFGLLIVDIDGEYYGLKEEYEILHAGADEECDIQVTEDHAEKLASLALEQNVPIILDVSSFLDQDDAEAVLTAVARHLFAKAKKQKQPFLLLVEEVHEYIPEGGSVGECGKMLIKIGKRGRKHGLGICGISQRPADVKKDFITQCDWLVWHRLTWDNDTNVVRRVVDGEYATAVEDLDDGEGFLMTDWEGEVRRVQFRRKQTFDAGATPGLDDFERPDLKSVSGDLVAELEQISDENQERETRITELREELDRKNSRIAELEAELQDARDLERMADQFVDALVRHVDGPQPGRTERERMRERRGDDKQDTGSDLAGDDDASVAGSDDAVAAAAAAADVGDDESGGSGESDGLFDAFDDGADEFGGDSEGVSADQGEEDVSAGSTADATTAADGAGGTSSPGRNGAGSNGSTAEQTAADGSSPRNGDESFSAAATLEALETADHDMVGDREFDTGDGVEQVGGDQPLAVRELKADIAGMDTRTREMLAFYRELGPGTPLNAHFAAGGDGDRNRAYAHNRRLRTRGLIEHVGRGRYDYRLRDLLREELNAPENSDIESFATEIEETALE